MGCSSCGDMSDTIKNACAHLVSGHTGVAALYNALAAKAADPEVRDVFLKQAEKHMAIAMETANVVLPEKKDLQKEQISAEQP